MDAELERRFVATFKSWLISLPYDLKILYEASSDENLPREARELATGAIIYAVSPNDFINADRSDFLSYCDDCILVRLALRKIAAGGDEDSDFFKSRFEDFFGALDAELDISKEAMGETFGWLESKVDLLKTLEYKGKKVPAYIDDDEAVEFLYEEGLGFATEYPVDEETLGDKLKKASTILEVMDRRKAEDTRK
mgnify:CR=1 FL=1